MRPVAIGIDIGGTNTKFGIADAHGHILASDSISSREHENPEDFVGAVHEAVAGLIKEVAEPLELVGIGVGAPNANYFKGTIEFAPNLRWRGVIPLAELFRKFYDLPVVVTNDANAAAIGEMIYGGAKGMRDFVIITLGTGVGSGFVANGQLIYGHDGFAGEFGHVTAVRGGRMCTCGRKGCVETYASARGVVLTVHELLTGTQQDSRLKHILPEDMTPKDVYQAAEAGDSIAREAFEYTGKILGESLSDMVAITSPEAIFFFGGVARAGDWILEPTQRHMEANLLSIFRNKVKFIPSKLPESDAAILGACSLVWKELGH
ncbi:MAG: ROK family protein [Bacteroidetes bacterium]|nr:MAG: ROK family protein [Bacteroidota bacterium]